MTVRVPSARRLRRSRAAVTVAVVGTAAIAGNAFVGRDALAWLRRLRRPRGMPTMPVLAAVGTAYYYAAMAIILHRALRRGDRPSVALAVVVLAGNELWNVAFFTGRSTRNGFVGLILFAGPVLALRTSARP